MDHEWKPVYNPWRHGGWYVSNIHYPQGCVGCVSNNYTDKKWRIVCGPHEATFPTRDAAAKAEYAAVEMLKATLNEKSAESRRHHLTSILEQKHPGLAFEVDVYGGGLKVGKDAAERVKESLVKCGLRHVEVGIME